MPVKKPVAKAAKPRAAAAARARRENLSADQLAELKQCYFEGAETYAELVELSGLDRFEFQDLVGAEGWGPRPAKKKSKESAANKDEPPVAGESPGDATGSALQAAPRPGKPARRNKKIDAPKPADLAKQMLGAVRTELNKLESQDGTTSQDRERGSRALMQLMNTLEKAVKMHKKVSKKPGGNKQHKETLKDAEAMRNEIAERLERLHAERLAQK